MKTFDKVMAWIFLIGGGMVMLSAIIEQSTLQTSALATTLSIIGALPALMAGFYLAVRTVVTKN